jgi:hypothetical protein
MTDEKLVMALRALLCAEDKPADVTPLDLLQTARLLVQHADEKDVYTSQDTLAEQLCSSVDSIARSQERLSKLGWVITRKGGYRGRTNLYQVDLDKLPIADLKRTMVSPDAKNLAIQLGRQFKVDNRKGKHNRGWVQKWSFIVQGLIDRSGGDIKHVYDVVNFAWAHPDYTKKVAEGPAALKSVWRKLTAAYADHKKAVTQ